MQPHSRAASPFGREMAQMHYFLLRGFNLAVFDLCLICMFDEQDQVHFEINSQRIFMSVSFVKEELVYRNENIIRPTKYKAKIDEVSPVGKRNCFEKFDKCFLGVSLENSNFRTEKLEGIVEWITRRFSNCTVLIGDSIHRLTLQSTRRFDQESSLGKALEIGREFVAKNKFVFENYCSKTSFTFQTCQAIQQSNRYEYFHKALLELADKNLEFYRSVRKFAENYHRNTTNEIDPSTLDIRIRTSVRYFLEEFAIFACLREQGHQVMIYPGTFSTLSEIASGLHHDAPDELKELTVVSLCLKGR